MSRVRKHIKSLEVKSISPPKVNTPPLSKTKQTKQCPSIKQWPETTLPLISINHKHALNQQPKRDLICFCIRTNPGDRAEEYRQRRP